MKEILLGKNILMLHSTSDLYGASRIFLQTAEILKSHGARIEVYLTEPGPLSTSLEAIEIPVHFTRLGILRRKYIHPTGIINRIYFTFKATLVLIRFIRSHQIDLVYNNATSVLSGIFAAKVTRTKHIWHIHEIIATPKLFASFTAYLMHAASEVNIFVSEATMAHWLKVSPTLGRKDKAIRIYNGVASVDNNSSRDEIRSEAFRHFNITVPESFVIVGMIGRINPWKGQGYFIEIARQLIQKFKMVHFVMAGDPFPGYEYIQEELYKRINQTDLRPYFTDLGYQKDNHNFFNLIDMLIVPSTLPDPLPTVVLEAMAHSKPVIGTRHGGITEMIRHQETGLLIAPNDAQQSAEVLLPLVQDKQLQQQYGEAGNKLLKASFSPESYKSLILTVTKNILDDQF